MSEFNSIIKKVKDAQFEDITLTNIVDGENYGVHFYFKYQKQNEKTYFKIDVIDLVDERSEIRLQVIPIASEDPVYEKYGKEIIEITEKARLFLKENIQQIPKFRLLLLMNEILIK